MYKNIFGCTISLLCSKTLSTMVSNYRKISIEVKMIFAVQFHYLFYYFSLFHIFSFYCVSENIHQTKKLEKRKKCHYSIVSLLNSANRSCLDFWCKFSKTWKGIVWKKLVWSLMEQVFLFLVQIFGGYRYKIRLITFE